MIFINKTVPELYDCIINPCKFILLSLSPICMRLQLPYFVCMQVFQQVIQLVY